MGQCHSLDVQKVAFLDEVAEVRDVIKSSEVCCSTTQVPPEEWQGGAGASSQYSRSVLRQKGFLVCVDSVDALLTELPYELDVDLEHLYVLPEASACSFSDPPFDAPNFRRDVGSSCQRIGGTSQDNQDNFACLQVDDLANPWGLYVVSDGHGPQGQLISTLLVHEVPGLLLQNPSIHRDSDLALYQTCVSAAEMATSCQFIDASTSGATLSAMLLRDGYLHVAWVGDAKIVLGRSSTHSDKRANSTLLETRSMSGSSSATKKCASTPTLSTARDELNTQVDGDGCAEKQGGLKALKSGFRAVELTTDHTVKWSQGTGSVASEDACGSWDARKLQMVQSECSTSVRHNAAPNGAHARASRLGIPRGLARTIGNSLLQGTCGDESAFVGKEKMITSKPDVRRLRIKPDDAFVVLGSSGFWKCISPQDAVVIVGQCICQPAWRAVDALVTEVQKRSNARASPDDLTVIVVYLAGERYIQEGDTYGAMEDVGFEILRETRDHLAGCGCMMTEIAGPIATESLLGSATDVGLLRMHAPTTTSLHDVQGNSFAAK